MNILEIEYGWFFLVLLPLVAFMYAAVGHGGASGYLAMMALFGFAPEVMKPTALLLNLFVAAISFFIIGSRVILTKSFFFHLLLLLFHWHFWEGQCR